MISLNKAAAAALASVALLAGASAASAQTFNQPAGTAVTANGQLIQYVDFPGVEETTCNVAIHGVVDTNGESITFTSYEGTWVSGGDLACDDSLTFDIVATPVSTGQISLDRFIVGTRDTPCNETNYLMAYSGNTATFNGQYFGNPFPICKASGGLQLTTDIGGQPVLINP